MFHVSNVPRAHTSPIRGGMKTYVMRRFELESWLRNIEHFQITEANMVPPMVIQVINSPLTKKYSLASIRNSWVGAAPLAAEPQARYKALLRRDTPFNQVWGMSETSCIATMVHYPEHDPTGSVGRFLPNHDAKLVASTRSGCFPAAGPLKVVELVNGGGEDGLAKGVAVEWGGHWCYWENPEKFHGLVLNFLK